MKGNLKRVFQAMFMVLAMVMLLSVPAGAASSKTVATIGKKSYSSLDEAVKKVKNGQTIKLQKNVKTSDLTLKRNIKYTINLNGYKLIGSNSMPGILDIKKGTVTIKNGTVGCNIYIYKNASVTLSSVKIQSKYKPSIDVKKKGTLKIKSGTYYNILNEGTVSLNDGTYYGSIRNGSSGKMTIKGGTFNKKTDGTYSLYNSGKMTISDGSFTNKKNYNFIRNEEGGTMTIKGGTFKYTASSDTYYTTIVNDNKSTMTISGGTFTMSAGEIVWNGGTLNIKGGTFTNNKTTSGDGYGAMVVDNDGTFKMSGGTLKTSCSSSYALRNTGTATLTGGTLSGPVYWAYNTGTLKYSGVTTKGQLKEY